MAEKLFEAHFESLQAVHADVSKYEQSVWEEMIRVQHEFESAKHAHLSATLGMPNPEWYRLKFNMFEKKEEFRKAEAKYLKAKKYLEAVETLLEAEYS